MKQIPLRTARHTQMLDITGLVQAALADARVRGGAALIFVPHTTAGITINEHADPDVAADLERRLDEMVPWDDPKDRHGEGNTAAHLKASLMGSSVLVPVENGRLRLGTWQGIFFCEFDGPRSREVWVDLEACEA
jgi:secondary thiamine-phosphate synthase enzyme